MYKVVNGMFTEIINDVFKLRDETLYHLKRNKQFLVDPIHSIFNGSESASYLSPKIWEQILTEIKNKGSLIVFKKNRNGNPLTAVAESAELSKPT